jgi:hypothetical protein
VDLYINIHIRLYGILIKFLRIGTAFLGVRRVDPEAENSPTITGVKKTWIYTSTPPYGFMG